MIIGEVTTSGRVTFPAADSSPLAIVSICLKGMSQTSGIPMQTFSVIKHYYADSRAKNLVYIELEFCLKDGTEDAWLDKLDKAIAPLIKCVEISSISLI
jgi:hypothetical protein